MFDQLIDRWWLVAARGAVAVVFGLAALVAPAKTIGLLVSLFAAFALADGIFAMGAGLSLNWLSLFLEGVAGGAIGLLTLFYPMAAYVWFVPFIVTWAIVTGLLELQGAFKLRQIVDGPMVNGEWLLGGSGVLSLLFAGLLVSESNAGPVWFVSVLGFYALMSGALLVALGFNIRGWRRTVSV